MIWDCKQLFAICGVIGWGLAPHLAPLVCGSQVVALPPIVAAGHYLHLQAIGGETRLLFPPVLIWGHLVTCSTTLPWSWFLWGPSGPAALPLLPIASATLLISTMFHIAPWW